MSFVHLHVHDHYSTLDGASKTEELVLRAKELGQTALAITNHGNMFGAYDLYKSCKKHGIQPIFGVEFYHKVDGFDKRFHIICLAKSMKGLQNLYKLHALSYKNQVKGAFGKKYPIVTYEDLFKYKEDIIVSSACLGGHISNMIMNKDENNLYITIELLKQQFGDDFYIELQSNSIPEQVDVNTKLVELAKLYNIKTIVTNDTHYVLESDYEVHEMLLCMQTKDKMENPDRFRFDTKDFWLKSEDEILHTTHGVSESDLVIAINNTMEVANKCKFEFELPSKKDTLPVYSSDENKELRAMVSNGWRNRKHGRTKAEKDRADYELDIIERKGYSGYHCIVSDYINYAKENGVLVGPGRGSCAGSFVAYLSGITDVNPLDHGLLFERYLNPERITSPDIDTDFSNQPKVFNYLKERWGVNNVSKVMAFGTLTAKAIFRKILSIHGFKPYQITEYTKSFPRKLELMLKDCESTDTFKELRKTHNNLIEAMYRLEGVIDHMTIHAAGMLITPTEISNYCPVAYDLDDDIQVVGFDKYMLEELGYYKFDILKLTTLNVMDDCIRMVKDGKNVDISISDIDYSDDVVYSELCNGNVFGVFQLESQPDVTKQIEPRDFEGLTALNALIRPGTGTEYIERKNGKPFEYYSDSELSYMQSTYNVIVYQEQVMMRVHTLAGWTLGKGDSLRKIKHIRDNEELGELYYHDCLKRKHSHQVATESWEDIVNALEGGYSFNKSHACVYADIAYKTAWLKYYYPLEYMCALMIHKHDESDIIAERVMQCKNLDIVILPPDINSSSDRLTIDSGGIRFALGSIDGVGEEALINIKELKPFVSLEDFIERADTRKCGQKVVVNLIKAGAFDFTDIDRLTLIRTYFTIKNKKKELAKYEDIMYNDIIKMNMEREVIGFYLSKSPLDDFNFKPLEYYQDTFKAIIGGEITKVKEVIDRNKRTMAFVTVTTQYNNIEVVVFANQFKQFNHIIKEGVLVMINGKRNGTKLLADEFIMIGGD